MERMVAMKCEEVRPLLPELAEGVPREAGEVERHLATCAACSADLQRYRNLMAEMGSLRDVVAEPSAGFLERMLEQVPAAARRSVLKRVASDERFQYAAFSFGGALGGRRPARRPPLPAGRPRAGERVCRRGDGFVERPPRTTEDLLAGRRR